MEAIEEFISFLTLNTRNDLKRAALQTLLGLTGDPDGRLLLSNNMRLLESLAVLLKDKDASTVEDCYKALINLSADESVAEKLVAMKSPYLTHTVLSHITESTSDHEQSACKLLCNLTRSEVCCQSVVECMKNLQVGVDKLVDTICIDDPSQQKKLHHLAGVFANLTQLAEIRKNLIDQKERPINKLLPITTYMQSNVRREGIVRAIRNCCFDVEYHEVLLGESIDILPFLLYPLAGPEEFDEEDTAKLPLDLQYLDENKERDPNPEIRKMLLEALIQLSATKAGRLYLRDKQAYLILRELHKCEKVPQVIVTLENAVQLLIGDEPEPEMENLKAIEIPEDLLEKFEKMDKDVIKDEEERASATAQQ